MNNIQQLLGTQDLVTKSGRIPISSLSNIKLIGLYFTAHWCPPCRTFLPKLINIYNTVNASQKIIEIVFISFDRDSETMYNYLDDMPWAAVPYSNNVLREDLGQHYGVTGIPALIIITPDSTTVSEDGRSDVYAKNMEVVDFWLQKVKDPNVGIIYLRQEEDEIEESTFSRDPVEGLVCDLNHFLIWHGDVEKYYKDLNPDAVMRCNYCKNGMKRSSWHCRECKFDLCKDCRDWVVDSQKFNSPALKCWENHFLLGSDKLKEFYKKKFGIEKYTCRACNTQQEGSNLHCRRCYFDICNNCKGQIEGHLGQVDKVKCGSGHSVTWAPDVCKRYKEKHKMHKYTCNVCMRSYMGAGSFNCFDCMFDVCVPCIHKALESAGQGG